MVKIEEIEKDPMEALVGNELIRDAKGQTKLATTTALKGKDLVLLYFSASWCVSEKSIVYAFAHCCCFLYITVPQTCRLVVLLLFLLMIDHFTSKFHHFSIQPTTASLSSLFAPFKGIL